MQLTYICTFQKMLDEINFKCSWFPPPQKFIFHSDTDLPISLFTALIEWYKEISIWSLIFYLPCWSVTGIWSTLQQCTCSGGKVNCPHGHLFPEMKSNEPIRPWHFGQYNLPLFQHPYKKTIKKKYFKDNLIKKRKTKCMWKMYLLHS